MKNGKIMENTLMCPVCGKALLPTEDGKSAACTGARRHLFDFASNGYINLHTSHAAGGDSDECIRARNAFLSKGYYSKIADQINALIDEYVGASPAKILDAGCGEGYYTNKMAENTDRLVYGFDLSKAGVKTGAKAAARKGFDERTFYGVASVFSLPVQPESMDAVTTIFSPCVAKYTSGFVMYNVFNSFLILPTSSLRMIGPILISAVLEGRYPAANRPGTLRFSAPSAYTPAGSTYSFQQSYF